MSSEAFTTLTSRTIVLREENIDTDQIIPARFLTTTSKDSLADACFHDWRFEASGKMTGHPLNTVDLKARQIIVSGNNFGCGSSREHAPWALMALGVRVVISTEIADIFRSNAMKNGLLPVTVDEDTLEALMADPGREVTVSLETQTVTFGNRSVSFEVEPFARRCLLSGQDSMDVLLSALPEIQKFEEAQS
ncbi:MAG: 3-isopropylmalate dehydratase small subunit [Pseudomonadota bacterium]